MSQQSLPCPCGGLHVQGCEDRFPNERLLLVLLGTKTWTANNAEDRRIRLTCSMRGEGGGARRLGQYGTRYCDIPRNERMLRGLETASR